MRKSATLGAPCAAVISLASYRAARSSTPEPETCDPLAVLETMIDCYFTALAAQVATVRATAKKSVGRQP